jgi:Ca-activated chloride channel family protein
MRLVLHLILKPHRENLQAGTAEPQKIFAMLKVIPNAATARTRPPLALALVVDTSGSMREKADAQAGNATKLDHAIQAAQALLHDEHLLPGDHITIIQYDDEARILLPLSPLGDRFAAQQAINSLRGYSGGTQMAKGLGAALQELSIVGTRAAQRVLVLTDGQAFDEDECHSVARQLGAANAPLIAIGVGNDYNEVLLRDLAEIGRGRPYHLHSIEHLGQVLGTEVRTSVREVVTDLQAYISTVKGVTVDSVTRVYPSLAEMKSGSDAVALGNIPAGDYTVFVLEITVAGMARPASRARVVQLQLSGDVPGLNQRTKSDVYDVVVSFSGDEAGTSIIDEEVLGYVQQRNADRMVQSALQQASSDVDGARRTLQAALQMTQRVGNGEVTRIIESSLQELDKTGTISSGTRKTVALSGRTRTVKTRGPAAADNIPPEEQIRKLTGA